MPESDAQAPPPESPFHGHDAPDRLETEEPDGSGGDGPGDEDEPTTDGRSDRPGHGHRPHGEGVKDG